MQKSATRVLITGANRGVGFCLVDVILSHNNEKQYHIIMTARDMSAGKQALETLRVAHQGTSIELQQLDISDNHSVDMLIDRLRSEQSIDILVNNAGVHMRYHTDKQSMLSQMATNYHGTVYLTQKMINAGLISDHGAIVMVSSGHGKFGDLSIRNPEAYHLLKDYQIHSDFSRLEKAVAQYESDYCSEVRKDLWPSDVYSVSKLFLSIWTYIYGNRKDIVTSGIQVYSCSPGFCLTNMTSNLPVIPPFTATEGAERIYKVMTMSSDITDLQGKFLNRDGVEESL
jgi:carbonyl reductase 1